MTQMIFQNISGMYFPQKKGITNDMVHQLFWSITFKKHELVLQLVVAAQIQEHYEQKQLDMLSSVSWLRENRSALVLIQQKGKPKGIFPIVTKSMSWQWLFRLEIKIKFLTIKQESLGIEREEYTQIHF